VTRSAAEVRNDFLEFFRARGHAIVPGSPVVPYDDPTLLFTNAGMNQFKDVFLGTGTRSYTRAADSQPCIRAGGKHNDLDDVGQDTYHHAFFEMLGNWSFGDYFKKEAIEWAWELLTEVWGLEKDRLHASYFQGDEEEGLEPDHEARDLWAAVTDIDPTHIHPGSKKDNFWEMGETGPCGPCSEIHIDLTPNKSGIRLVNLGDPRVIELWNLVFIQFNRDAAGKLTPLPARHVDTGMGFERICALLQGKTSNYDTDIFTPIFQAIRDVTGAAPYRGTLPDQSRDREGAVDRDQIMIDVSYRVIADHIRCLTFALNDGAVPDREGRGYVLRRILRRAVRYGWQYMNMHEPFLYKLVPAVVDSLGDAFPQLRGRGQRLAGRDELTGSPAVGPEGVAEIIREEEESFDRTLDRGIELFEVALAEAVGRAIADDEGGILVTVTRDPLSRHKFWRLHLTHKEGPVAFSEFNREVIGACTRRTPVLSGKDAFRLHDTYGFPIDLTELMAEEKGLKVDTEEFDHLMEEARDRARAASSDIDLLSEVLQIPKEYLTTGTDDSPKYELREIEAKYLFPTGLHESGTDYWMDRGLMGLVFDRTCFYAEQGGQVGDEGYIRFEGIPPLRVSTTKRSGNHVIHLVDPSPLTRERHLEMGATAVLTVDTSRRGTMKNHTATHVVNWALREVLGEHVQQKGSLVDPEKTRFDFSHPKPLTPEEIERVEQLVNERIRENLPVHTEYKPTDQARNINGLRAVFGEKYPDPVRVVCCGVPIDTLVKNPGSPEWRRYPIELCGGTHCKSTGEIEHFAIVSEEAVAKGIRRVVGISGEAARLASERGAELLKQTDDLRRVGTAHRNGTPKGAPPLPGVGDGPDSEGAPSLPGVGDRPDFATQVAELQQAVNEATIRVVDRIKLRDAISELQQIIKQQQKAEAAATMDVVADRVAELLRAAPKIGDTTVVVAEMPELPIDQLKTAADMIKQKCKSAAVLFGVRVGATERRSDEATKAAAGEATSKSEPRRVSERTESESEAPARAHGKALLLAAMSNDLVKRGLKAGDLIKHVAPLIDGRGGGPPTMAQAGGKNPGKTPAALAAGRKWIEEKLQAEW
jgi:alanyl-tRNA synthetase